MILPDKNITLPNSILGIGSDIITVLEVPQTVTSLWEKTRRIRKIGDDAITFEKFILTLDFLYTMGLIEYNKGLVSRVLSL